MADTVPSADALGGDVENPIALMQTRGSPTPDSKRKSCLIVSIIFLLLAAAAVSLGLIYGNGRKNVDENSTRVSPVIPSNTNSSTATSTTASTTPPYAGPVTTTTPMGPVPSQRYASCDDLKNDVLDALKDLATKIISEEKNNDWFETCDPKESGPRYPWWYKPPTAPNENADGADAQSLARNQEFNQGEADIIKTHGALIFTGYNDVFFATNTSEKTSGVSMTRIESVSSALCGKGWGSRRRKLQRTQKNVSHAAPGSIGGAVGAHAQGNAKRLRKMQSAIATHDYMTQDTECHQPNSRIVSLIAHGTRLAAIVSKENSNPSIISDHSNTEVLVYDISKVPIDGSPLKLLGTTKVQGNYHDARSINSTGILVSTFPINTWYFTEDLYRIGKQYCGLSTPQYEKLATEIALSNAESFMEEMAEELELDYGCSRVYQVADMHSLKDNDSNEYGSNHLGGFVQVSSFNMSSNYVNEEIPVNATGAFAQSEFMNSTMTSLIDVFKT